MSCLTNAQPEYRLLFNYVPPVNTKEFERQYQASISQILSDLQSMAIVSNRLEAAVVEVGVSVQNLNEMVEDFLDQQERRSPKDQPIG